MEIASGGSAAFVIDKTGNVYASGSLTFASGTITGNLDMGANPIENLGDPNSGDDAMDRDYADTRYVNATGDAVNGNVGLTQSGATATISIYQTGATDEAGYFEVNNAGNAAAAVSSSTNGTGNIFYGNQTGTGGLLRLDNAGTEKFVIDNDGNVGIGAAAPTSKLHVINTAASANSSYLQINNAANADAVIVGTTNGTGNAALFESTNAASDSPTLYIDNDGATSSLFINNTNGAANYLNTTIGANLDPTGTFNNASSRALKFDITPLTPEQCDEMLEKINNIAVSHFKYKVQPDRLRLGVIAEDSPDEMTSEDKKGVQSYGAVSMLIAAMQAQQREIEELKARLKELEAEKQ